MVDIFKRSFFSCLTIQSCESLGFHQRRLNFQLPTTAELVIVNESRGQYYAWRSLLHTSLLFPASAARASAGWSRSLNLMTVLFLGLLLVCALRWCLIGQRSTRV